MGGAWGLWFTGRVFNYIFFVRKACWIKMLVIAAYLNFLWKVPWLGTPSLRLTCSSDYLFVVSFTQKGIKTEKQLARVLSSVHIHPTTPSVRSSGFIIRVNVVLPVIKESHRCVNSRPPTSLVCLRSVRQDVGLQLSLEMYKCFFRENWGTGCPHTFMANCSGPVLLPSSVTDIFLSKEARRNRQWSLWIGEM